mmetsp:Transcript_6707/g.15962  ORF Transcript_6707/g.15962 Transcript_6707/m.15962 type:complete len:237 (+) Transcript_6707:433-1143(+)
MRKVVVVVGFEPNLEHLARQVDNSLVTYGPYRRITIAQKLQQHHEEHPGHRHFETCNHIKEPYRIDEFNKELGHDHTIDTPFRELVQEPEAVLFWPRAPLPLDEIYDRRHRVSVSLCPRALFSALKCPYCSGVLIVIEYADLAEGWSRGYSAADLDDFHSEDTRRVPIFVVHERYSQYSQLLSGSEVDRFVCVPVVYAGCCTHILGRHRHGNEAIEVTATRQENLCVALALHRIKP